MRELTVAATGMPRFLTAASSQSMRSLTAEVVSEGDRVMVRWTARGTHRGGVMGTPPSRNRFAIGGLTLLRIAEGRIAEHWVGGDFLGLMEQIGAIPAPGQPG